MGKKLVGNLEEGCKAYRDGRGLRNRCASSLEAVEMRMQKVMEASARIAVHQLRRVVQKRGLVALMHSG